MTDGYRRTELPGGLVVLTEAMPGIRSASLGVWVRAGSVTESIEEMGISHLLEHMVFKGTHRRSAKELAIVLERLGGSLDAYTTREHTSFQARVLDTDVDVALDVLGDLVLEPMLRQADLDLEREVVLEEIATVEDTPDDLVFDLHAEQMWGRHPYGFSILGTRDTVSGFTVADLRRVHESLYHRGNIVIAGAGSVDHDRFVEQVSRVFEAAPVRGSDAARNGSAAQAGNGSAPGSAGALHGGSAAPGGSAAAHGSAAPHAGGAAVNAVMPQAAPPVSERIARASAQTHIVWGAPTFGQGDPRRFALVLLSNAFGGGMSSRLFQRVREDLGLAYAVYGYQSFYAAAGVSGVYVGTRPDSADRAEAVVGEEMAKVAAEGIAQEELDDVKGQVKGQIVLSLESSSARLHRLAGTELYSEPFRTMDEITALVDAVSLDEVAALAADYFPPDRQSLLRLGPTH